VKGTIIDAESKGPLVRATIALRSARDSSLVSGALTDREGAFTISGLRPGRYYARVSYVGYRTRIVDSLVLRPGGMERDLGAIALSINPSTTGDVTVSAERDFMTVDIDRTVYKTQDLLVSTGGTATDLLRNIPSIEVDVDGNVSLRGNQNVVVQINGRPLMMSGDALTNFLRSLSASSIERVEVIPNPSAKYDPDGMSGIINIVLKQSEDRGLSGGLNAGAGTRSSYNIGGNINYGSGPWNIFANYGFNTGRWEYNGTRLQENRLVHPLTGVRGSDTGSNLYSGHSLNGTIDYALDKMNSLSLSAVVSTNSGDGDGVNHYFDLDSVREVTDRYDRLNTSGNSELNMDYRLGYKWVEQASRHEFSVEARYSTEREDGSSDYRQQDLTLSGTPANDKPQLQRNDLLEKNRNITLQADYVRPLWESARLETGYKGSLRRIDNTFYSESFDYGAGEFRPDMNLNNTFVFDEKINALYATYSQDLDQFGLQLGLRAEDARTTFNLTSVGSAYDNNYFSLFPSAFVSYKPAEGTQFKLGYSRRINRPRTGTLNPFSSSSDPNFRRVGNPYLKPEYTDSYELNFTQFLPWGTATLSPYFRHTTNGIQRYERFDSTGMATLTFENFGKDDSYGAEFITTARVDRVTAFANVSVYRSVTDASNVDQGLTNDAIGWTARANATVDLGLGLSLQANGFYRSPFNINGGQMGSHSSFDMALQKKLFDDKARIGLRVSDLFNTSSFNVYRGTSAYYEETSRHWGGRSAMLTFSYTFGTPDRNAQRRTTGTQDQPQGGDMGW
jgi:outer membrane receptor protein involved in Fe transport